MGGEVGGALELNWQSRTEDVDGGGVCRRIPVNTGGSRRREADSLLAVEDSLGRILTSSMPSSSRRVFCTPGMISLKRFLVCGSVRTGWAKV